MPSIYKLVVAGGEGAVREFVMVLYTLLYLKMDNQQVPTVWHRELCLMLCGSQGGKGVWGRVDTCTYTAESLPSSPEAITTLVNQLYSNTK